MRDEPDDPFGYEIPPPKPTVEKLEALIATALGLKPDEVGTLLSLSPNTVTNHRLAPLREELQMGSTLEVYTYAQYRGWITAEDIDAMWERIRQMRADRRGKTNQYQGTK
jgi:DNA-binding CsgD family transcriptional regulator